MGSCAMGLMAVRDLSAVIPVLEDGAGSGSSPAADD
jgi:hypothetical protein